jgi:transcriptional repressor NrdR
VNCPICAHPDHRVLRTQETEDGVRRTRECLSCAHRWFTIEAPEEVYRRAEDITEAFRAMQGAVGE